MKICLILWPECQVSEGSAGGLPWAPHAWRLLDRMGFGHVHQCFFFDHLVSGGSGAKLCYLLSSWDMSFLFHGEVSGRECHGSCHQSLSYTCSCWHQGK